MAFEAANRSRVCSLYRRSLKLSLDWIVNRQFWRPEAIRLRQLFEANRHVTDPRQIDKLYENALKLLEQNAHPEPYIGGTQYERNMPPPILELQPDNSEVQPDNLERQPDKIS